MARDGKPTSRTGSVTRSIRARKTRDSGGGLMGGAAAMGAFTRSPTGAVGLLVAIVFAVTCGAVSIWARNEPLVAVGRVMDRTRNVRVDMVSRDTAAERAAQESARARTPRIYVAEDQVIDEVTASLTNLPAAVAGAAGVESLDAKTRTQFGLNAELLTALKAEAENASGWKQKVDRLAAQMREAPVLESQAFQRALTVGLHTEVVLRSEKRPEKHVRRTEVWNLEDAESLAEAARLLARDAGFFGPQATVVANRLRALEHATFREDENATVEEQNKAAAKVTQILQRTPAGQPIFQRGEVLTAAQYELYRDEMKEFVRKGDPQAVWLPMLGIAGACGAISLALAGYTAKFVPRIRRNPGRMISTALILGLAFCGATAMTVWRPDLAAVTVTAPIILVAMVLTVAYDQRVALAHGVLLATLTCISLDRSIGMFAVLVTGISASAWRMKEIRDRGTVVRASVTTALGAAAGMIIAGLVERPILDKSLREILIDAAMAGAGAVLCGGVMQFVLPMIERAFDVATGLTLIELRDPKQPLLRELQVRAAGTYNHSLNVASIAESAAEAIGADRLLTYVGALYHDIGKMNKPEYFVENRVGGENKHDKLSPALSLLIIVGHVKDGMELAEQFALPKALRHFIEAHHGTTLVEYFYHRAKAKVAEGMDAEDAEPDDPIEAPRPPDEIEYRYPGPRPRTKEVAIVMVADAVESATRAMPDPTPGRIEALVQQIAHRRLMDGQFNDCDLTLKDLRAICDSISRTMASIYHGRIAYPGDSSKTQAGA